MNEDISWDWEAVSANPSVTWEDILRYDHLPWNFRGVSRNPNITIDILNTRPLKEWSFENLAKNPNIITMNKIDKHYLQYFRTKPVNLLGKNFSENPAVTWEFIQEHPYIDWDYSILSKHPNITWETITHNPEYSWDHHYISANPNICWDIVNTNNVYWDYHHLSSNPGITIENIIDNLEYSDHNKSYYFNNTQVKYNWCWFGLSCNPNVTWEIVKESENDEYYKDIKWSYYYLSKNPNITIDIIRDNPDKNSWWSIRNLSANPMESYDWDKVISRQYLYILK